MPQVNRESAEEFLEETVTRLCHNGWQVAGRIQLIDLRNCPVCGSETLFTRPEHICPVCSIAVRFALPPPPPTSAERIWAILAPLVPNPSKDPVQLAAQVAAKVAPVPDSTPIQSVPIPHDGISRPVFVPVLDPPKAFLGDSVLCTCGGMMIRSGSCYTCSVCGNTSGCG